MNLNYLIKSTGKNRKPCYSLDTTNFLQPTSKMVLLQRGVTSSRLAYTFSSAPLATLELPTVAVYNTLEPVKNVLKQTLLLFFKLSIYLLPRTKIVQGANKKTN